jgi:hypothetical protein
LKPIVSVRDLSSRLGVRPDTLRQIGLDIDQHYSEQWLKKGKKSRRLDVPGPVLKALQRRINRNVLAKIPLAKTIYGGVAGGSPRKNAGEHIGQPCVITMDVKEFFPKVRHYMVLRMFRELGFGREVASLLTRLTTYRSFLPQGAPTSTVVANLLLAGPVDGPISAEAERRGWRFSRFVDDIAISGKDPRPIINLVARFLSSRRLPIHRARPYGRSKLRITPNGRAQIVTGLVVNAAKGLSVPRARRDKIRAAIYALRRTPKHELEKALASVCGKVAYVAHFNPGAAKRLKAYLESTLQRH